MSGLGFGLEAWPVLFFHLLFGQAVDTQDQIGYGGLFISVSCFGPPWRITPQEHLLTLGIEPPDKEKIRIIWAVLPRLSRPYFFFWDRAEMKITSLSPNLPDAHKKEKKESMAGC